MALNILLEKLIEIERSIGHESQIALRRRVIEAQEFLLAIQQKQAGPKIPARSAKDPKRFAMLREFKAVNIEPSENN